MIRMNRRNNGGFQSAAAWVKEQLPHFRLSDSLWVTATCEDVWPPRKMHEASRIDPMTFEEIVNQSIVMSHAYFENNGCTPKTLKGFSRGMTAFFGTESRLLSCYLTELAYHFTTEEREIIPMSKVDKQIIKASGWFEPEPEVQAWEKVSYERQRQNKFSEALGDCIYSHLESNHIVTVLDSEVEVVNQ